MKSTIDIYDILIHGLFASLGGIVRELKEPDDEKKPKRFIEFVSGSFIGIFCGLVVYFICKQYSVGEYLTIALTGLAGYMGTPVLDFIARLIKEKLKMQLIIKNNMKKILDYIYKIYSDIKQFIIEHTSKSLREAIKEFARIGLIASVLVGTKGFYDGNFDIKSIILAGITAIVKAIDKYIHEQGKIDGDENKILGITRF